MAEAFITTCRPTFITITKIPDYEPIAEISLNRIPFMSLRLCVAFSVFPC